LQTDLAGRRKNILTAASRGKFNVKQPDHSRVLASGMRKNTGKGKGDRFSLLLALAPNVFNEPPERQGPTAKRGAIEHSRRPAEMQTSEKLQQRYSGGNKGADQLRNHKETRTAIAGKGHPHR